ncbi:MAG TPA: peptide-methionine (S)-S-oxide reductase, partial [Chitinophagaceae bacterium]|nr:peptide-methionine (S)-S-oxide reductase [Chitinophagaceae bacterium]
MKQLFSILFSFAALVSCAQPTNNKKTTAMNPIDPAKAAQFDTATFGAGCFWCVEAIFQRVKGVEQVLSGYGGGHVENPTYEQVCDKTTGHVELCRIIYDPKQVSFDELLEIFWKTHDPTTPDRQGNDVGPQYRSVVFYHNELQRERAEYYKN